MINKKDIQKEGYERLLIDAKTIVIKVGTSTLINSDGVLNRERMEALVASLAGMVRKGRQIVLVSSGAVGAGFG